MMLSAYCLLALLVALFELTRRKAVFIDFMTLFNMFFCFGYLMPAILFLLNPAAADQWRFLAQVPEAMESFSVWLAVAIGYVSVAAGYWAGGRRKIPSYPRIGFKAGEKIQFQILVLFFAVCAVAFLVYAHGHGGIIELLLSGKDIRAGRESAGPYQYAAYLASGLPLSMLFFYSLWTYSERPRRRRISGYLLILSFLLSLINAIGIAGRGKIGMVFLVLLFFKLNSNVAKITAQKVVILLLVSLFVFGLVKYGKSALWTLGSLKHGVRAYVSAFEAHRQRYVGTSDSPGGSLVGFARHVDHGIASVYVSLSHPEVYQAPRLFFDWIRAFLDALPGIRQPEYVVSDTPAGLNRIYFQIGGYVPPGWVAMKIINGGGGWLIAGSFLAGFIGGYLERLLLLSRSASSLVPALFIHMAFFWKDYIVGPDPFMAVLPNLSTFLLFGLLAGLLTIRINRVPSVASSCR